MSEDDQIISASARVRLDGDALVSNWRKLNELSGKGQAGAAVKADAYGLGAVPVVARLEAAGCRDFFVANWQEALEIETVLSERSNISVLNGVRDDDMATAKKSRAKPVLNSLEQIRRWSGTKQVCDVMINSGMNRLGVNLSDLQQTNTSSLNIDMAMSHLASADEDVPQNSDQLDQYRAALAQINSRRQSLANSAGIMLGSDYHFDCTRPGLSLYGGKPRAELENEIRQVAYPQAQILQVRNLDAGDKVGYNAKYVTSKAHPIATLAMGYADGYLRGFSDTGLFHDGNNQLPVLGRVSMDLVAIDISAASDLAEGDWVDCEYDLPTASAQSGLSQYELLTGLGQRLERIWA